MQWRIAGLVALLLVAPILFSLYLAESRRANEREHYRVLALATAQSVASHQTEELTQVRTQMTGLARLAASGGEAHFGGDCRHKLDQLLQTQPEFYQLGIVDIAGNVVCTAKPVARSVNLGDREYFQRAVATRGYVLSDALVGRSDDRWSLAAAHPVLDEKQGLRAVLVAALDLGWSQRVLEQQHLPPGSIVSMVDAAGTILARVPDPSSFVGKKIREAEAFAHAVKSRSEGVVESAGLDGVPRIIGYASVGNANLFVRVGIPVSAIESAGRATLTASMIGMIGVMLASVLIAWIGARGLLVHPSLRALTHDGVTGLANRATFLERLGAMIEQSAAGREPLAVFVLRLPRLQEIYDGLGYDAGVTVLREIQRRLSSTSADDLHLARLQSEEFGVFLAGCDNLAAAGHVARLQAAFREPVRIGKAEIDVAVTIGASFYPGHGDDAEALLRRAAIAAREGTRKELGFFAYRGATERENPERLSLAAELRVAIEQRVLVLHYQPKFDIRTRQLMGCEALIRWPHPTRGMIPPVQFVPIAEETGLIRQMTYLLLDLAVRQQHAWLSRSKDRPVAVNLSVRNLYDPGFLETLTGLLNTWGLPAERIDFEITESALVDDPETARQVLSRIRALGSKIYIDDFGTGYSSLNYLVTLPVHALKIDRSFVQQMLSSREAHSVVASVISLAHSLGLRVVAEGVETEDELAALDKLACDKAQGYLLGKPVSAEEFESRWLA